MTRQLQCTSCWETVEVHEIPPGHIDPDLFICGECMVPCEGQPEFREANRVERREYLPEQAEIGF
jgi:hypothetical protein